MNRPAPDPLSRPRQGIWLLPVHLLATTLGVWRLTTGSLWIGLLLLFFGGLGVLSWFVSRAAATRISGGFRELGRLQSPSDGRTLLVRVGDGHTSMVRHVINDTTVTECETELRGTTPDGSPRYLAVSTGNLEGVVETPDVPGLRRVVLPAEAEPLGVIHRHRRELEAVRQAFPELSPVPINTIDDVAQQQARLHALYQQQMTTPRANE